MPGHPPSVPGVALWGDSDVPAGRDAAAGAVEPVRPPANAADRPLPTIGHIGRYALKYQLGEGGLGTVFAAHDPLLSRLIAVKTLNVELPEEKREAFNTLFINEARAAGGLSHPHIVTVFDAGISDKRAYIAMELLKGRDLRQLRQEGWRATPAQAALIVRRVADALSFAHSKGVIHRDIKPANIFMVGRTQPRVLDFGIARVAHQQTGDANIGAGSPYYMAPEQILKEPTADRRVDVFSLGVVLYELLTDEKPFRGESLKDIRHAVLMLTPPLASEVDRSVPKALAEIAARAMAKDPDQRIRSARSFARELRQWLDANPAVADGDTVPASATAVPSRKPLRRRAWVAAIAATATIAAIAAIGAVAGWPSAPLPPVLAPVLAPTLATVQTVEVPVPVVAVAASTPIPTPIPTATPDAVNPFDPGASATAARTVALSTPEALMSASLGLINAPASAAKDKPAAEAVVAGAAARESARERRVREAREREARARELRTTNASLVAPATGTVRIAISPWGQVEVDGNASGVAPPLTELTLSEGRHQIVVRNGDFAPYVTSVTVVAGQRISLHHKFGL